MTYRRTRNSPGLAAALFALAALALAVAFAGSTASAANKKKIVALTPFSANALAYSGVKPVAIGKQAAGHKAMSPKLKGIRRLALSHPNGPNMEEIAKIDPDVVLSSDAWAKGAQTMRDLAITVRLLDPGTVNRVVPQIKKIGNAYGSRTATAKYAKKVQRQIKFATSGRPIKKRPRVLALLGVGRAPQAFMNDTWGASVINAAGGKLITEGLSASGGFARVSDEWIITQNPDVIVVVPHGNRQDLDSIGQFYRSNPAWSTLDAVKNDNVAIVGDDALLQPDTDVGNTIKRVRVKFLKNW